MEGEGLSPSHDGEAQLQLQIGILCSGTSYLPTVSSSPSPHSPSALATTHRPRPRPSAEEELNRKDLNFKLYTLSPTHFGDVLETRKTSPKIYSLPKPPIDGGTQESIIIQK